MNEERHEAAEATGTGETHGPAAMRLPCYAARAHCGCVVAAILDTPLLKGSVSTAVQTWARKGLTIERMEFGQAVIQLTVCDCKARAKAAREAAREAARAAKEAGEDDEDRLTSDLFEDSGDQPQRHDGTTGEMVVNDRRDHRVLGVAAAGAGG